MKIKTQDLTGAALDWAVAKCEGLNPDNDVLVCIGEYKTKSVQVPIFYTASTNWAQGGPIIEREELEIATNFPDKWAAQTRGQAKRCSGPTPLIAAMRCYVASKLGYEVEIPEVLT